jgi:hypothetical protein
MKNPSALLVLLVAAGALAQEPEGFALNYTHGVSFSVMAVGEADAFFFNSSGVAVSGGGGAQLRLALSGFLIGLGLSVSPPLVSPAAGVTPEVRLSLGYAVALSRLVALSPAVRGGLLVSGRPGIAGLTAGVELPVTLYLARRLFIEPFAFVGALVAYGVSPIVSIGLRAGWTF